MVGADSRRLEAYRAPIDRAWAAVAVLVPVLVVLLSRMYSIDLAYHLRAGTEMREGGGLIRSDTWTFGAPGAPWLDQQWGAQLLLSMVHELADWAGLLVVWALLVGVTFGSLFAACRARGASARWAAVLTLAGFLASQQSLAMRPQTVAMPAFAIALWAIASRASHPQRMWLLPLLAAVVANLHGSFVLFPLLAALTLVEDLAARATEIRRGVAVLLATTVATLINPFGIRVWTYAYDLATNDTIRDSVVEWRPVTLTSLAGILLFSTLGLVVAVLARRREPVAWTDLLWLGVFLVLGLSAQRSTAWWGLVFPVVVAGWVRPPADAGVASPSPRGSAMPANVIIGTLVAATLVLLPWWRGAGAPELLADVPFAVSERVDGLPDGSRVFVHQPWGSWFEYATPHVLVFVDSRIELFDQDAWDDYDQVAFAGASWEGILEERDPDAIVAATDWDLLPMLREDPRWRLEYEDDEGLLFVRV